MPTAGRRAVAPSAGQIPSWGWAAFPLFSLGVGGSPFRVWRGRSFGVSLLAAFGNGHLCQGKRYHPWPAGQGVNTQAAPWPRAGSRGGGGGRGEFVGSGFHEVGAGGQAGTERTQRAGHTLVLLGFLCL